MSWRKLITFDFYFRIFLFAAFWHISVLHIFINLNIQVDTQAAASEDNNEGSVMMKKVKPGGGKKHKKPKKDKEAAQQAAAAALQPQACPPAEGGGADLVKRLYENTERENMESTRKLTNSWR